MHRLTPARAALLLGALLIAALGLAACGSDDDGGAGTEAATTTTTETVTTEVPPADGDGGDGSEAEGGTDGAAPPADREVRKLTGFSSPSGNIGCVIDRRSVRCDIDKRDWDPPKPPRSCKLDYGQGITMRAGSKPELVCAGDTTLGAGEALPYGQSIAAGLLRCESEEEGISCRDIETGRGFTLSRGSYELR